MELCSPTERDLPHWGITNCSLACAIDPQRHLPGRVPNLQFDVPTCHGHEDGTLAEENHVHKSNDSLNTCNIECNIATSLKNRHILAIDSLRMYAYIYIYTYRLYTFIIIYIRHIFFRVPIIKATIHEIYGYSLVNCRSTSTLRIIPKRIFFPPTDCPTDC